jgi:hypothetical protein
MNVIVNPQKRGGQVPPRDVVPLDDEEKEEKKMMMMIM